MPIYSLGTEIQVMDVLYIRTGLEKRFSKYNSEYDDSDALDNLLKEFGYSITPTWGIGLTSEAFSYLPYNIQFDFSSKNIEFFGTSKWFTFSIGL